MSARDVKVTVTKFGTRSADYLRGFEDGVAAYEAALAAAGYAVVPREPTEAMLNAWKNVEHWLKNTTEGAVYTAKAAFDDAEGEPYWTAMLAAAEEPQP